MSRSKSLTIDEGAKNAILQNNTSLLPPGIISVSGAFKSGEVVCILDKDKSLNISQLSSLINESSFVVANDTGPAHMAAHLNTKGLALFGKHTTAHKVSIEREHFKAIQVENLNKLSVEKVFERLKTLMG